MIQQLDLRLLPKQAADDDFIRKEVLRQLRIDDSELTQIIQLKRSIDARKRQPLVALRVEAYINEAPKIEAPLLNALQNLPPKPKEVIIVGAGPAGYFAALQLIELGIKPIIFERGKGVRERRRDLRSIQQLGEVDPHSNYCFGEGGAGTYSDGKLYTRSKKRGNYIKILRLLVEHGAKADILIDAHPHIGSNKLPNIVAAIRETILKHGGEIHFYSLVTDFILEKGKMRGVVVKSLPRPSSEGSSTDAHPDPKGNPTQEVKDGGSPLGVRGEKEHFADAVILATGHSARDIFYLLEKNKIHIEAKAFALGVRIEHEQSLIDDIQYHGTERGEHLPASSYKLVSQVEGRGVFSFCMCPGGLVVPSATAPGEIVVNGMSMSKRDSRFANSGTVVAVETEDLRAYQKYGVFAGLEFQKKVEQMMFAAGNGSQQAPAQRLTDFSNGRQSKTLNETSYIPGLFSAPLHRLLPKSISQRLRKGVRQFDQKMRGYYTQTANVIGVESRTSSPIRIPRVRETYMHEGTEGLFPCGEGAGYAGGILSAAIDGQNVAKAVAEFVKK